MTIGVVVIGRNEGERLKACLKSVTHLSERVYVDSGSSDGSIDWARSQGVMVVDLAMPPGFTAARARNAGFQALLSRTPGLRFVQMLDGDCELAPQWVDAAINYLTHSPEVAVVFGQLRERNPKASLYNRLCATEWSGPAGLVASCGGIAMFRAEALGAAGGYTDSMIAGEEPDLCFRMRGVGWRVVRIDEEMALHDAAMTRFSQYWRRAERGGHAFAELTHRHGWHGEPKWRRQILSIGFWAGALPFAIAGFAALAIFAHIGGAIVAAGLLLLYPFQVARLARRDRRRMGGRDAAAGAILLMIGKFAQLRGIMRYWRNQRSGRASGLIEYKDAQQAPAEF